MFMNFLTNILSHILFLFGYISNNSLFPEPLSKTEEEYYLNHYDNLATLSKDLETKTLEEIRQETGYYNVPNYEDDGSYNNGGGNHIWK